MSQAGRAIRKWWWTVPAVVALLIGAAAAYLYYWPEAIQARIRRGITRDLQERFHSDVELADLQIKLVPRLNVTGHNLALRYHGRKDIPPLIQIASFSLSSGYLELLRPVKHIPLLQLEKLQITIPPRDPAHKEPPSKNSPLPSQLSKAVIDRVICQQAVIRILPRQAGKEPLDWDIHNLTLTSASSSKPFAFHGDLTNGKPIGEIATDGMFGPWNAEDPAGRLFPEAISSQTRISHRCPESAGRCRPPGNTPVCWRNWKWMVRRIRQTFPWTLLARRCHCIPISRQQ